MLKLPRVSLMLVAHQDGRVKRLHRISMTLFGAGLVGLTALGFWTAATTYLEYENLRYRTRIDELEQLKDQFKDQLHILIEREETVRMMVGLPDIHPDVRQVGVGGHSSGSSVLMEPDSPVLRSERLQSDLNQMLREARLSLASLDVVEKQARTAQNYWDHMPTVRPVSGVVTSNFGLRKDPFTGTSRMHGGIDIAARSGTPVRATANGTVIKTGLDTTYGIFIDIDHKNGYVTRFGHLSAILVKQNQTIERGAVIGKVGKSGRAMGYHLHYEIRRYGKRINPALHFWTEQVAVN